MRKTKRGLAPVIQPDKSLPLPELEKELQDLIKSEMRQQVKLSDNIKQNQLPSIGSVNLLNANRQVNCTTLSETGDIMACGMADSSVKVFYLNKESLMRSLNLSSLNNPFAKRDPLSSLNMPYTVLSDTGLKMQLYADQVQGKNVSTS